MLDPHRAEAPDGFTPAALRITDRFHRTASPRRNNKPTRSKTRKNRKYPGSPAKTRLALRAAGSESPVRGAASAAKRAAYAQAYPEFWAVIDGYEYALHDVRGVTQAWVDNVRAAAQDAFAIYTKAALLARTMDASALESMGFPSRVIPLLRLDFEGLPTLLGRFDLIESTDGFKVIEFNAETPFFVMEAHEINGAACAAAGLRDPNIGARDAIVDLFAQLYAAQPGATIGVTASNVYREDYWTAAYYAQLWNEATGARVAVVPIHELQADRAGVYNDGRRIDLLHRCYPLEYAANDPGGEALAQAVAVGAVTLINPPSALFAQNKLVLALIWGLYERGAFFDECERAAIAQYFLPAYAQMPQHGTWACKPVFGREGSSVRMVRDGVEVMRAPAYQYDAQPAVYQQWVDPPEVPYRLSDGTQRTGRASATCAVTGGVATAAGMRIGDLITDGWAHFAPIGISAISL